MNGYMELSTRDVLRRLDRESEICVTNLRKNGNVKILGTVKGFIQSITKKKKKYEKEKSENDK